MVRTSKPPQSDNERLSEILESLAAKHHLEVHKAGWARTTYDVFSREPRTRALKLLVRVESFATTSGEIRLMDPAAQKLAEELGGELEKAFDTVTEAVIIETFNP